METLSELLEEGRHYPLEHFLQMLYFSLFILLQEGGVLQSPFLHPEVMYPSEMRDG